MYALIERYINNMNIYDLQNLAISKGIDLSQEELDFSYNFIKKNWKNILLSHGAIDLQKYKDNYSEENFIKIEQLINESLVKYSKYL